MNDQIHLHPDDDVGEQRMTERATIASVAEAAGVSRQTVSNALNAPERVRPVTLDRVRRVIEDLGYRPSSAARQMRTGRSRLIAMRIEPVRDGVNGVVADRFVHALAESAQDLGYRVLLCTATDDASELAQYADLRATMALDGVILSTTHRGDVRPAWLAEQGLAHASFGRAWDERAPLDVHWVDVDGAAGTRAATEHLLALGHRRVALLGWPGDSEVGRDRRSGWEDAMAAAGLTGHAAASEDDVEAARTAAARLLDEHRPSAVVCVSDSLAIGVASEVARRGQVIGREVSVVGFDDTPAARALGLASVEQPLDEVARLCVRDVLHQLGSDAQAPVPTASDRLLAPTLRLRPSVAAPPE